jgi:DNA replication protein DnaC
MKMAHLLDDLVSRVDNIAINMAKALGNPIADGGRMQANCPKHGVFFSKGTLLKRRETWSTCEDCRKDSYLAELEESRLIKLRLADGEHQARLERAAIPARFKTRTLENFRAETPDQIKALTISRDFAAGWAGMQKKGAWLVFSGKPGTGKSHLAIAILQAIMPGSVGRYMTCMELIQTLRATWRKDSDVSETDLLESLTYIPLLVLDEIGVQYGTESEQHHLFDVLDRRYREMRPTILLTNQNKDGFRQFVGDRVYDRMTEVARWVPFDWDSHRIQARKDFA